MPNFEFKAMDSKGREVEGTVEADTQAQAVAEIRANDIFPTRVTQVVESHGCRLDRTTWANAGDARKAKEPKTTLTKCPDCGSMVSKRADTCPNCGAPASEEEVGYFAWICQPRNWWRIAVVVLIFYFGHKVNVWMSDWLIAH